jgi:hypothetical protein
VKSHDSVLYTFWKNGQHLCVKRLTNYNFYSQREDIINPDLFPAKDCAAGKDYQIDLVSVIDCPITTVNNNSNLTNVLSSLDFSFEREDGYPIVDFDISEYNFCEDFGLDNISPGRKFNYILEKRVRQECASFDQRTVTLDQQS